MRFLIFKGIMRHPLPLHHIFLLQDLPIENRMAIDHGYQQKDKNSNEVRKSAPQKILTTP